MDIAKMANVSHTTVSRALSGEKYVSPETYDRIMKACQETGYTPNAIARKLKSKTTNTIGIIVPDIGNIYFSSVLCNFEKKAHIHGYQVFISSSFYDYYLEEQIIQNFLQNRLDGIVVSGAGERSSETLLPYVDRVPIVFIGDNIPAQGVSSVTADSKRGTYMATRYLLDLGHRQFAFVGGRKSSIPHCMRIAGFEQALQEEDVKEYQIFSTNDGSDIIHGYETGSAYFKQKSNVTAFLAVSSQFALGFIQAATEHGFSSPQDYSIIGFDENRFAALPQISLSTISQSENQIVESAFELLIQMIAGSSNRSEKRTIEPSLIIRSTCRSILGLLS